MLESPKSRMVMNAIAWSPDSRWLASASDDVVHLRDLETGDDGLTIEKRGVQCIAFAEDGTRFAMGDNQGTIHLHELPSGIELARWNAHVGFIRGIDLHGDLIVTGGEDGLIQLRGITSHEIRVRKFANRVFFDARFAADGRRVVFAAGATADVWELGSDTLVSSPVGFHIVSAVWAGDEIVWGSKRKDADAEIFVGTAGAPPRLRMVPGRMPVTALAVGPARILLAAGDDGIPRLWDLADGRLRATLTLPPPPEPSPTRRVVTPDFRLEVPEIWKLSDHGSPDRPLFTAPDGSFIAFSTLRPRAALVELVGYCLPGFTMTRHRPLPHATYDAREVTQRSDDGRERMRVYVDGPQAVAVGELDCWGEITPQHAVDFERAALSIRWN